MQKLPAESDTRRNPDYIYPIPHDNRRRKNYRALICKILIIIVILLLIGILSIILIKIFVLNEKKEVCSDGFFHPDDDENNKSSCYPCKLSNCKNCEGKINTNICIKCKDGFNPEYNEKNEIINCGLKSTESNSKLNIEENIKCSDNCLECNINEKKCSKCEVGYFLPDDSTNKLQCEKCSLNNCEKCQGNKNNDICTLCKNDFIPKYDINNKIKYCNEKCQTGENKKCKECDFNKNECLDCNSGFYLPSDDDIKLVCKQCSLEHCQSCHGANNLDICDSCENNFIPVLENNIIRACKLKETTIINCEIGDGDKCLTCSETENNKCNSCNPSYKLVNGKCILDKNEVVKITELKEDVKVTEAKEEIKITEVKEELKITEAKEEAKEEVKITEAKEEVKITEIVDKENDEEEDLEYDYVSFTAKYSTPGENKQIPIIYSGKNSYIKKMKVNGVLEDPKVSVDNNGTYLFKNSQNREHTMDIWLEINENILKDLFYCIHNLISIKFIKFKNSKNTKITSMENMFYNCTNLISIDISVIDTKDITNMHFAFIECNSLKTLDLSKNNFTNVRNAGGAFAYCNSLTSINLDTPFPNLESFDFGFYDVHSIKSLDISKMKPQKLKYMYCLFYDCTSLEYVNLNNFKTDLITDMHSVFYNCNKLTSVDLSQFNTKNVKDMQYMFYRCFSLTYLDLSSFDTSQVTNMIVMFHNCHSLTSINFGNTFNTSKVNDMSFMFDNCTSLTQLDLRQFNTKNVKNMQYMFRGCKKLKSVDISSFDTSLVTKFEHIFSHCSSLTSLDLSNFNFTECDKHSTGPPIMYYCESLKYIDITPISIIFRDFFTGIPNYGGKIRASRKLQIYLLQTGIRVLLNWDWEIVNN